MQEQSIQDENKLGDAIHELWLIYCQLKDAEENPADCEHLISSARAHLGEIVNVLNHCSIVPKSPSGQAANLNCRCRHFNLTLDIQYLDDFKKWGETVKNSGDKEVLSIAV